MTPNISLGTRQTAGIVAGRLPWCQCRVRTRIPRYGSLMTRAAPGTRELIVT